MPRRLPMGQLTQLHAIFVRRFCPPEGYSAMFNGGMLVSRRRIRRQPQHVWQYVQAGPLACLAALRRGPSQPD